MVSYVANLCQRRECASQDLKVCVPRQILFCFTVSYINWHCDFCINLMNFNNTSLTPKSIIKEFRWTRFQTLKILLLPSTKGCNPHPGRALWGTANPHSPKRGDTSTSSIAVSSFLESLEYKERRDKSLFLPPLWAHLIQSKSLLSFLSFLFLMYK